MLFGRAAMIAGFVLASSAAGYADITRHCNGRYVIRDTGQSGFVTQLPNPDFATAGTCGSTVPNRCRERARDRANRCMQAHWDERWNRNTVPGLCLLRGGQISGYTVRDLKDGIEKAACCGSSPLRNRSATLIVQRMSWGDTGCGSGKRDEFSVQRHFATLSTYDVDCPQIRQRLCP
jgi:hypothetical protein